MNDDVKMVIVIRKDLKMRRGKENAQSSHAAMKFLLEKNQSKNENQLVVNLSKAEVEWFNTGTAKISVRCEDEAELNMLIEKAKSIGIRAEKITDSGRTEFHGVPTVTCAAFGPDKSSKIDQVTGELKLL